jgi:uncharacterized protein (UPF0333 family)
MIPLHSRGQALAEYSLLTFVLVLVVMFGFTARFIPVAQQRRSLLELFLDAYQTHYKSFYEILDLPFP